MGNKNYVFIARSLDGYIADKDSGIDWLHLVPNPDNLDLGYNSFNNRIDAIVLGRNTYEVVLGFNIPWPYTKPVYVVSNSLEFLPDDLNGKAELVKGALNDILEYIHSEGSSNLYIDGGSLVQSFLREDLIDEMILTTIPVLLGGGIPLFGELPKSMEFKHVKSEVFLNAITQDSYRRRR